jgi:hypothetical protein
MACPGLSVRARRALTPVVLLVSLLATPAHALRLVSYNILNYPGSSGAARAPYYRAILTPLSADVIVTGEMASLSGGETQFLNEVLNVMEPGQWAAVPFVNGNDSDAACFYRISTVQFLGQWSFYPNPANLLRLVHVYRLKPVGYVAAAAEVRIYAAHLKASDTSADAAQRLAEVTGLRDSMNAMPVGTHALALGDFNFYRSTEAGYQKFLESQANNTGRVYDLLPAGSWHDGASYAAIHTQSPCKTTPCASGAATGGLDDRFDFILPTYNLGGSQDLGVLTGTCIPVGNDGLHLNLNITDPPTIPEGAPYATALKLASDHLPVRIDLRVPARITTDAALAFGSAIVGAPTQSRNLTVNNPALAPADSLRCSFAAPAGFAAPGPLALAPGGSTLAAVTMSADHAGSKSGDLTVSSNAVDAPTTLVGLSGTVLDHAEVSLDSLAATTVDTLDFGDRLAGWFTPLLAAVHDRGYDALHARLLVSTAQIVGGDGRFSIPGFSPSVVDGTAGRWPVQFDDAGATVDSTYEATLTFTSADEPLPGATGQPDVGYLLRAHVVSSAVSVEPALPAVTRLYAPRPNPLTSGGALRFDLAGRTRARLEIFDLSGRRVALLADRELAPGRYDLPWDGHSETGVALGSGLYFVRLTTRGCPPRTVRLALVR